MMIIIKLYKYIQIHASHFQKTVVKTKTLNLTFHLGETIFNKAVMHLSIYWKLRKLYIYIFFL